MEKILVYGFLFSGTKRFLIFWRDNIVSLNKFPILRNL